MKERTNTARWTGKHWRIDVQRDGEKKSFYSSTPGRTGQREANAKADAWLNHGIAVKSPRVSEACKDWLKEKEQTTSHTNYRPLSSRWNTWVLPVIGNKRVNSLTDQNLQTVINRAYAAGKSKKTLLHLKADMDSFCKYCRKAKISMYRPEDVQIPAGARYKGKNILQPSDLRKLFSIDTTTYKEKTVKDEYINAYRFQALTGLRPGELIGLRWSDIRGNTVNVSRSVNIEGKETQGKNQNAVRSFVLSDMARKVLEDQRELTWGEESVFCILTESHYRRRLRIYCETNGIGPCTPYELRHTFVSLAKTLPAGEVKELVGHSANMDTFGVYGQTVNGEGEATAQAVNAAFLQVLERAAGDE